jgi:hypothetical protein
MPFSIPIKNEGSISIRVCSQQAGLVGLVCSMHMMACQTF